MPIIVDEVVISVEVTNREAGGAASAPPAAEARQEIVRERAERGAVSDRGTLERLTIKAYEKPDYAGRPIAEFEAYVNPSEITIAYEIEYDSAQGSGTTNSRMDFKKVKPGDLSLTFFVDGT